MAIFNKEYLSECSSNNDNCYDDILEAFAKTFLYRVIQNDSITKYKMFDNNSSMIHIKFNTCFKIDQQYCNLINNIFIKPIKILQKMFLNKFKVMIYWYDKNITSDGLDILLSLSPEKKEKDNEEKENDDDD